MLCPMLLPSLERRADEPELMDAGGLAPAELDRALDFLVFCNGALGGWAAVRAVLERWSRRWPRGRRLSFLDVGTGAADIPRRLLSWGRARGFDLSVTAIDTDPAVLALARRRAGGEPGLELLGADLEELARAGRRFDYVMGSLVLHHVPHDRLAALLRLCDRLAERGLLFCDLHRNGWAYAGVRAATFFGGRVSRHDGPLSVRRAFRPAELLAAALEAKLDYLGVAAGTLRLLLSGEKA